MSPNFQLFPAAQHKAILDTFNTSFQEQLEIGEFATQSVNTSY